MPFFFLCHFMVGRNGLHRHGSHGDGPSVGNSWGLLITHCSFPREVVMVKTIYIYGAPIVQ